MIASEKNITSRKRLPEWIRRQAGIGDKARAVKKVLRSGNLHTVCEEARCPNLGECFGRSTATFLILGSICTRNCGFCSVSKGMPAPPDPDEPGRVAEAARTMSIKYVVITSVTRDDLPDGGAASFAETVREVGKLNDGSAVEVLTPDFRGNMAAVELVCIAGPDVYNHNIETVPSLYRKVRPQADYARSLYLLDYIKKNHPRITTKSGLMLGLGEGINEVIRTLEDLRDVGCDLVTIGQYMRPTRKSLDVAEYIRPAVFQELEIIGKEMGFKGVYSGPLVRSSYNAESLMDS